MKIGFLITARLKSKRLLLKILKDLNGRTVVERIIDRTKMVKDISGVVLCTSTNSQDKPLIDIAKNNRISYFKGDEKDVLKRLLDAAKFYNLDYFLSITADNPLFSIRYSNLIVAKLKKGKYDFIKIAGLPLGTAPYGVKVKALTVACKTKTIQDTEIWGRLMDQPKIFNVYTIKVKGKFNRPELRLTLDYDRDYQLINHLYSNLPFKTYLNLSDVIHYIDRNPEIAKINQSCIQRDLDKKIKEEIDQNYRKNIKKIKK